VWLGDEAREMVHHLKYQGYAALADAMAAVIARFVATPPGGVLVPVPLARSRQRTRGYNQAAILARALAERWPMPVREDLLRRTREATSQTALTPEERLANVAGAFSAAAPAPAASPASPASAAVIIVDDVLTTGATLHAAATALSTNGWSNLGAVTFARALPFELRIG
jgi:ComF family protein